MRLARGWGLVVVCVGVGCDGAGREREAVDVPAPVVAAAPVDEERVVEEPVVEEPVVEAAVPAAQGGTHVAWEWLRDSRQPKNVDSLYARGKRGQFGVFDGYLACKVSVVGRWDDVPFSSRTKQLPDIRVALGDRDVMLPEDRSGGYVGFNNVHIDDENYLKFDIDDVDPLASDDIDEVTLIGRNGSPMEVKTSKLTLSCVPVAEAVYTKDVAARRAAADKVVAKFESAQIDLAKPQASLAGAEAAREAVRQFAMLGKQAEVDALALRLEKSLADWKGRLFAAMDAKAVGAEEWRALGSVKVRRLAGQPDAVEISAEKPLRYDWVARRLVPLSVWFIDDAGQRVETAFLDLSVDGEKVDAFNTKVAKGKTVILRRSFDVGKARYLVVGEGKGVLYFSLGG